MSWKTFKRELENICHREVWGLDFYGLSTFIGYLSRRNILAIWGKDGDFPRTGLLPTFWPVMVHLGTVIE